MTQAEGRGAPLPFIHAESAAERLRLSAMPNLSSRRARPAAPPSGAPLHSPAPSPPKKGQVCGGPLGWPPAPSQAGGLLGRGGFGGPRPPLPGSLRPRGRARPHGLHSPLVLAALAWSAPPHSSSIRPVAAGGLRPAQPRPPFVAAIETRPRRCRPLWREQTPAGSGTAPSRAH